MNHLYILNYWCEENYDLSSAK